MVTAYQRIATKYITIYKNGNLKQNFNKNDKVELAQIVW